MLPFNLVKHGFKFFSQKITFTFTSAPIPRLGWTWMNGNIKSKALAAFIPDIGDMLCGIVPTSCNNVIKVSLITDIHYI